MEKRLAISPRQARLGSPFSAAGSNLYSRTKPILTKGSQALRLLPCPPMSPKSAAQNATFAKFAGNGKIDVLINSAAAAGPRETVAKADGEEYLGNVQANLAGAFWVAQAFICHAAPDAVVVDYSSSGFILPTTSPRWLSTASRTAWLALTRT